MTRASRSAARPSSRRCRAASPASTWRNGETAIQGTLNKDAATLLTISDLSILETKIKVDETDVSRIKLGDSAVVQIDAFPDTTFVGRVVRIANSSVKAATADTTADQAVDYEVVVQLVNAPNETRPDFSATAKVITDVRHQGALDPDHRADRARGLGAGQWRHRPGARRQEAREADRQARRGRGVHA